jgi:hypothetical protein
MAILQINPFPPLLPGRGVKVNKPAAVGESEEEKTMGTDKQYWEGVKDRTPEDEQLAQETEREEKKQGVPQAPEKRKEGGE